MYAIATRSDRWVSRPARLVTVTAWLTAGWCVAFAAVNAWFEVTGHFGDGKFSAYASGLSVMDWLMVGLKLVGAAIALLSVSRRTSVPVAVLGTALWGAFATLAIYAAGNIVESAGMLAGVIDPGRPIRLLDVGYVVFFAVAAAGFGVLAISYARRSAFPRLPVILGVLAAPVLIAGVLLAIPAVLAAFGLLPN